MPTAEDLKYAAWQNRSYRFYLASRLLFLKNQQSPAAYCAVIGLELLLKGTLIYWKKTNDALAFGHAMAKLTRCVSNQVPGARGFTIPQYFYHQQRYMTVTRYPTNGAGVGIPASFLVDLDESFCRLISFVPFQFNTQLSHALDGSDHESLLVLRRKNQQVPALRKHVLARSVRSNQALHRTPSALARLGAGERRR